MSNARHRPRVSILKRGSSKTVLLIFFEINGFVNGARSSGGWASHDRDCFINVLAAIGYDRWDMIRHYVSLSESLYVRSPHTSISSRYLCLHCAASRNDREWSRLISWSGRMMICDSRRFKSCRRAWPRRLVRHQFSLASEHRLRRFGISLHSPSLHLICKAFFYLKVVLWFFRPCYPVLYCLSVFIVFFIRIAVHPDHNCYNMYYCWLFISGTEWQLPIKSLKIAEQRLQMESGFALLKISPSFQSSSFQQLLKKQARSFLHSLERCFILSFSVSKVIVRQPIISRLL